MPRPKKPYRSSANDYLRLGWLPLPVEGKFPPVVGATGHSGTVTEDKVDGWRETHAEHNVALRADEWVAIDVDHYGDKRGADVLADLEARLGPLPKTCYSTARGQGHPSRQQFYRVKEGERLVTRIGDSIELVQWFHRYSVVWPSVHPSGAVYQWYGPKDQALDGPPAIETIPDLPQAWVDYLSKEPEKPLADGVTIRSWRSLVSEFLVGEPCLAVQQYAEEVERLTGPTEHVSHDDAWRLALRGFMLGREGHTGVDVPVNALWSAFTTYIQGKRDRDNAEPRQVFEAMSDLAQRKVLETTECSCSRGTELTEDDLGGPVPTFGGQDLAALLLLTDLILPSPPAPKHSVNLNAAAAQFLDQHPVRVHQGSSGAVYIWDGDRWTVTTDLPNYVYRWLNRRIPAADFKPGKADELYRHILAHAPQVGDDDLNTRYVSVANGLLDWQTGELIPRTRAHLVVNHIPHAWRPEAKPGRFKEWLASAIDPEQQETIWEILGYAISPVHDLKVALALTGQGGGGKSTFVNVVTALVGTANCAAIAPQKMGEGYNPAEMFGKTVNAAGDVGSETMRNLGFFKAVVAGDEIQAERKYRDPFRFRPRVFNLASFNVLPAVEQNDSAFWDRWLVLGFQKRFNAQGNSDNYFRDRMPKEKALMEGVLVEAVRGLQRLRERGNFDTEVFGKAKEEWRRQVDHIAAFVHEHLEYDPTGIVPGGDLFLFYKNEVEGSGGKPKGKTTFYRDLGMYLDEKMRGHAYKDEYKSTVRFVGVKVVVPFEEGGLGAHDTTPSLKWGAKGWTRRIG